VIQAAREFRRRLLADPAPPAFHFTFPEDDGRPGDPTARSTPNGRYHLMYLYTHADLGSSGARIEQGPPPLAAPPVLDSARAKGDEGCFSGGAFVDRDGRAHSSYWGLWAKRGSCLAFSNDGISTVGPRAPRTRSSNPPKMELTETKDKDGKPLIYGAADPRRLEQGRTLTIC